MSEKLRGLFTVGETKMGIRRGGEGRSDNVRCETNYG